MRWFEFDPGYLFIRLLAAMGLVWNVRVPGAEEIALRRLQEPALDAAELEHV